jgi:hypothetical protein
MELPIQVYKFLNSKLDSVRDYKGGLKSCCPFHDERTGSFFVYYYDKYNNWFYKCFGCDAKGSLHNLMYRMKGPIEFVLKPIFSGVWEDPEEDQFKPQMADYTKGMLDDFEYLNFRGVSSDVCKLFGFKLALEQPAIVFPVYFEHSFRGAMRRYLNPDIKYRYEIDSSADFDDALWGYDVIDPEIPTIVTEGIIDAACWISNGIPAVALMGKKWRGKTEALKALSYPIFVPDNYDDGSIDMCLSLLMGCRRGTVAYIPPGYKDTSQWFVEDPLFQSHQTFCQIKSLCTKVAEQRHGHH